MIYRLLLRLVHHILALGVFLKQWLMYFPLYALAFQQKTVSSASQLRSDARTLKKIPNHLGIVVVENGISYVDIANIILWTVALGISYISVYDFNGEFKRNSKKLEIELDRRKQQVADTETNKYDIVLHSKDTQQNQTKLNGYHDNNKVHIQLLSLEDGRQDLVNLTQHLCEQVTSQHCEIDDITPQHIENLLYDIHKFPDPDLVLKFGDTDSLLGFIPWQTRLTEILSIPSHKGYSYKSFLQEMSIYGRSHQRFGK